MINFISVVDNNTKNVYRWIRQSSDGSKTTVNIPKANWKPASSWTSSEVEALFSPDVIVIEKTDEPLVLFDVAPDVLIDVAPELVETPTIPEEIVINEAGEPAQEEQSPTFFGTTNS